MKNIKLWWASLSLLLLMGCSQQSRPPLAQILPDTLQIHQTTLVDDYAWLKDKSRSKPEVLDYLQAENEYTANFSQTSLQSRIYDELLSRMDQIDSSVPYRHDYYYYYTRQEKDKQYSLYCRKKGSLEADEEIILDPNILAAEHDFFSVGSYEISPNHRYLAYSVDYSGSEDYRLYIKDLYNNHTIIDSTLQGVSGISWANDNQTIFYCREDLSGRTNQVFRHSVGNAAAEPELIYEEPDAAFYTWTHRSRSGQYIFLTSGSKTSSETWLIEADNPQKPPKLFAARQPNHDYYVQHHPDKFYIQTNRDQAQNYKLMTTALEQTAEKYWQEYIPHRPDVRISADLFQNFLVIKERQNGNSKFKIINFNTDQENYISFEEEVYTIYFGANKNFETNEFRYSFESLTTPYSIKTYDVYSAETTLLKQKFVQGGFSRLDYQAERIYATAADGSKIPISLVYNKNYFAKNGKNPLLLTAYGAYGDSFDPYFSANRLTLLDRGFIYAIAHVRGGGELGEAWYDQGKMLQKKNSFTDLIAALQFLIIKKYSSPEQIAIEGGSAGGLLVAAVTNLRPELVQSVIADVPFVDITNTMLDPSLSAVVSEYEEWGNPLIKEQFDYILSYDPYQNISAQAYPNILAIAGFYDTRVNFWEPAKWVAKLRQHKTDDNLLLLYTNMNAGHSGASGRYDYYDEIALKYAFLFKTLKVMY